MEELLVLVWSCWMSARQLGHRELRWLVVWRHSMRVPSLHLPHACMDAKGFSGLERGDSALWRGVLCC